MTDVVLRPGGPADVEPAVAVWRAANAARKDGCPVRREHEERVRGYLRQEDAILLVADADGELAGMALGLQGLADEGTGPPVPGLCHVSMVFVAPDFWGKGVGGRLVDAVLDAARSRGYDRVQLWTQNDNARGRRLYESRGFRRSGREKHDGDLGEWISHYERAL